jgi:hypothetical protein
VTPLSAFKGCWDRIWRAESHRKAFAEGWRRFLEDEPYSSSLKINDDGTGSIYVFLRHGRFPDDFAFLLGEFLYQLRAALDSAVYAAAVQQTGQDPPPNEEHLEFPIRPSEERFHEAGWHLKPLTDDLRAIVESVQPYKAPELTADEMVYNFNRALGILNDWARIDRHRRLHVLGSWASNANPMFRLPPGCGIGFLRVVNDGLLEHEDELASFGLVGFVPGMDVQANPNLTIDVTVDERPHPCADNDTLGLRMEAMLRAVRYAVGKLEASFPGGSHG